MPDNKKLIGPLARLSDDDVVTLLECSLPRSFRADETILAQKQMNSSLFVVMDGTLHVRRHANGRQVLLGRLGPGSFFGDISIFDPGPTSAEVFAVSPGRLVEISGTHLERFMQIRPSAAAELLAGLLELMAKRLRRTDDRLIEAIFWGGLLRETDAATPASAPATRRL